MNPTTSSRTIDVSTPAGERLRAYLSLPPGGSGPGIVLCQEIFGVNQTMRDQADHWAQEGYVVLVPDLFWRLEPGIELGYTEPERARAFALLQRFDLEAAMGDLASTVQALRELPPCTGKVGAVGYCLGGKLALLAAARDLVEAAAGYYGVGIEGHLDPLPRCPTVLHFAEDDAMCGPEARTRIKTALRASPDAEVYTYPGVDHAFARRGGDHYHKPSARMADQRTLAVLRRAIGPRYDLSALWDRHTEYEFATRDVDATMATMVPEPYVNHIPTMTGGVGYRDLYRFYKHHFIPKTPADTRLIPLSRTVGANQIVDEQLFCFTHDSEIDWMLPGIPPTGRYVEIPLVAIVQFRGDKLCHEHIYWDQASVLVQIGLLDPAGLPVAGRETAAKLLDESLPSNTLMKRWADSEGLER